MILLLVKFYTSYLNEMVAKYNNRDEYNESLNTDSRL